jgi:hypothetical protein
MKLTRSAPATRTAAFDPYSKMSADHDYNPAGEWSAVAAKERYLRYAAALGLEPRNLAPRTHRAASGSRTYPIVDRVVEGIRAGDLACVELGVEFIESAARQPFGRILHANVARAVRGAVVTPVQVGRLRHRILEMLVLGQVPHEYHEYAKLLRRIGLGPQWPEVQARVNRENRYVMRYVNYFERHCAEKEPRRRTRG